MANTDKKPVKKFQAGGVSGALWKNTMALRDGRQIETLSVSLDRRYKNSSGEWQNSSSFGLNDVPKALVVLSKAYAYMVGRGDEDTSDETPVEAVM